MNSCVKLNIGNIRYIEDSVSEALYEAGEAVRQDVQQSQTMPFDTGQLQNRSTFVDKSNMHRGTVSVVSDTPYARRLYFHPEYRFNREHNPSASAEWFKPYISGIKKDYAQRVFRQILKARTGG